MEQNGSNQNLPPPTMLCRSGCGFYGSPSFEGMCSKCYKDMIKRRQQNSSPTALLSQTALSNTVSENTNNMKAINISQSPEESSTTPSVETGSPTVPSTSTQDKEETPSTEKAKAETEGATAKEPVTEEKPTTDEVKKPKKNKCHTCKKKVGLTGFQCRCGGLYCSLHRYSDKHDCQFDYKELAQAEIRKHNPVVVGSKIQKI